MSERVIITVRGQLADDWSEWFAGLTVRQTGMGNTVLRGHVADQAALHGILERIRDLNLSLVRVQVESENE